LSEISSSFPGSGTGEGLSQATAGQITISPQGVEFQAEGVFLAVPMTRLQLSQTEDGQLVIEDPTQPEVCIRTQDQGLLDHPQFNRHHLIRPQIRALRHQAAGWRNVRLSGWLVVSSALIILVGWLAFNLTVNVVVSHVSPAREIELSKQALVELQKETPLVPMPELARRLEPIQKALLRGLPPNPYHFEFRVIRNEVPNAFALPGGLVYVDSALFSLMQTPEELAGVLAHELAHVIHRHGLRQLVKTLGPATLMRGLFGDESGLATVLSLGSLVLIHQERSREFERQADETGWKIMTRANIDPRGMISALEKLSRVAPDSPHSAPLRAMMSHPPTQERIDHLKQLWQQTPRKTGFLHWEPYQDNNSDPTELVN
jgi:beta-barrel assembly-enhancing protease